MLILYLIVSQLQMMSLSDLKPLRPAASLIINFADQGSNSNKILAIVRKPHMSFANSLVFPGGVTQEVDKKYLPLEDFQEYAKITAIRQTMEQTGILLLPSKSSFQRLLQFKKLYQARKLSQIEEFISKTWSSSLKEVIPLIRLVTPQIRKLSRFDCMFYTLSEQVQKINLGASQNLQNLDIHTKQSNQYFWLQPKDYLLMAVNKELQLPPPQTLLFNIFNNVPLPNLKEILRKQPVEIEPLFFQFSIKYEIIMLGDKDYSWQVYFQNEPESHHGKIIKNFMKAIHQIKSQNILKRRIMMKKQSKSITATFIFQGTVPEKTLLRYLPLQSTPAL